MSLKSKILSSSRGVTMRKGRGSHSREGKGNKYLGQVYDSLDIICVRV